MIDRRYVLLIVGLLMATCLHGRFTSAKSGTLTYHEYAKQAVDTLLHTFYDGRGRWRMCVAVCRSNNQDWGADALTYTLFLHWQTTHDAAVVRYFQALEQTAPRYGPPCTSNSCKGWSDVPEWDAVAALRDYEITADSIALDKAKAAYERVEGSHAYALGACPSVRYQVPFGGGGGLKTLETDANAIKAGLLLYRFTKEFAYLTNAMKRYAAVRQYFLDPHVPLYSVYLYDNGTTCTQLPRRFFASVNGLMISNGALLAQLTGRMMYLRDAQATVSAVAQNLADERGVYEDLQAENDVVEPLVESMYDLTTTGNFLARAWIMTNAAAAVSAREQDGSYGRFFGGPPPSSPVTAWQTNGGLSLEIAASALSARGSPAATNEWRNATFVESSVTKLPATLRFTGSRIALIGTLGEVCCQPGHARVFIDGRETFDKTGIWQNKSSSGHTFPNALLFAWQWHSSGKHTLQFYAGVDNPKEGRSFLHLQQYFFR